VVVQRSICSIDETGLCWKTMSMRITKSKTPGFKVTKEWVIVKLDCNAERAYKLISTVTYHTVDSRALRWFPKSACSVEWQYMKNSWTPGPVFTERLTNQLYCELNAYCKAETAVFTIFIVLDNAPWYPPATETLSNCTKILLAC
jgi:hypothetical protein